MKSDFLRFGAGLQGCKLVTFRRNVPLLIKQFGDLCDSCRSDEKRFGERGFESLLAVSERVMRVWSNTGWSQGSANRSHNRMQHEEIRDRQFPSYSISVHPGKTAESRQFASYRPLNDDEEVGQKVMKCKNNWQIERFR